MNTWSGLTRWQFEAMSEAQRAGRIARWREIITGLQADHYARYHGPFEARLSEWSQTRRAS